MTKRWFVEDHANQPHLWEEDTTVFDWLKSQLDPETGSASVSQVGGRGGRKWSRNYLFKNTVLTVIKSDWMLPEAQNE